MDRDTVINRMETICDICKENTWRTEFSSDTIYPLLRDAIAILQEQEAVEPRVSSVEQRCGNCNKVIEMDGWKACPWCGKLILWESVGRTAKQK